MPTIEPAERGMRTVREAIRIKQLELKNEEGYDLAAIFLPFVAMDCTNTRNFIPNARSSPRISEEIVTGAKVNFRTDLTASTGRLVMVKTNDVTKDGRHPHLEAGIWPRPGLRD